jgi:hypothetical protein
MRYFARGLLGLLGLFAIASLPVGCVYGVAALAYAGDAAFGEPGGKWSVAALGIVVLIVLLGRLLEERP